MSGRNDFGMVRRKKSSFVEKVLLGIAALGVVLLCLVILPIRLHPEKVDAPLLWDIYNKLFFGVDTLHSPYDGDGDGIDDYTDIMLNARAYIRTEPTYDASWANNYPPDALGVCTDVIWKALEGAGYGRGAGKENEFKLRVDEDIRKNRASYPKDYLAGPWIDFRRVANLKVYFERYHQSLTLDVTQIDQWQPGDIVFYAPNHVAIVSNRRNEKGQPWIIHFTSDGAMEEDNLDYSRLGSGKVVITGHYRWAMK